ADIGPPWERSAVPRDLTTECPAFSPIVTATTWRPAFAGAEPYASSSPHGVRERTHLGTPAVARQVPRPLRRGDGAPHRRGQGEARLPSGHSRPSLSARRSDQIRRLYRRLLQARSPREQAPRGRVHHLLRRALHGGERR